MEIIIHGDKLEITEAMRDYIKEKLSKLDKYLEDSDNVRATVVVKIKNPYQIVEVTIPLRSFILRSEEKQQDVYAAMDIAIDKLERQIRKNKTKLASKQKDTVDFAFTSFDEIDDTSDEKVIKRKKIEVKPMDEEEAILQMELLGHQFFMYKDSETNKPALVYKRKDNGYGIIESE